MPLLAALSQSDVDEYKSSDASLVQFVAAEDVPLLVPDDSDDGECIMTASIGQA